MSTLDRIPIRAPREWDPAWFERFLYETLAPLIASAAGTDPDSDTVAELLSSALVTAEPSTLNNGRTLTGQPGVLKTVDHGAGQALEVRVEQNGIKFGHIMQIPGPALVGAPIAGTEQELDAIPAAANDTVARRVSDTIDFGQLTVDMAPDGLWTYSKLQDVSTNARVLGLATGAPAPMTELTVSQVLDMVGSASDGDMLVRVSGAWVRLPAGSEGDVLRIVSGVPTWVAPDWAPDDASYVTAGDETPALANSVQLTAGAGIQLNAGAGTLEIENLNP